jgi:hypothetical protein
LLITQFDLKGIEKLGLIKIDLLGISALTVVADCLELIQQREPAFSIESIPLSDPETARTLSERVAKIARRRSKLLFFDHARHQQTQLLRRGGTSIDDTDDLAFIHHRDPIG